MGTPTNRTPVRVARGSTTALNTGLSDIQEGEIVWDTTLNKLQVKEGSALEDHTVAADATKAPIASPTFTGTVAIPNIANVETAITAKAPLASPTFTGTVAIPNIANVETAITGKADLTGATFTGDVNIGSGSTEYDLKLVDNGHIYIGDISGAHLNLVHNDTGNSLVISTAPLYTRGTELFFQEEGDSNKEWIHCLPAGSVELSYDDSKKFETTSSGVTVTGAAVPASFTSLTSSSNSTAVDLSANNNFDLTLNENSTLASPSNQTKGQSGSIFITQDGTGSRTLAYHADWKWAGGTAPTLSTAAASIDRIDYIVAATNKIHAVATLAVA